MSSTAPRGEKMYERKTERKKERKKEKEREKALSGYHISLDREPKPVGL